MAQEATPITTGAIKQNKEANGGDLVRPGDVVTVYATDKAKFQKVGAEMEVHPALAEKLIASGKATDKAPAKK